MIIKGNKNRANPSVATKPKSTQIEREDVSNPRRVLGNFARDRHKRKKGENGIRYMGV